MKCLKCHNNIYQKINCIFCKNIYCSYECMESHMLLSHQKNLLINFPTDNKFNFNKKNHSSNLDENQINIESPYLIPGILNNRRKYDEKYNLNNFLSIFENEKPKIIGGGSFGEVFLVMNTKNEKLYAIKHMSKNSLSKKLNSLEGIYKEIYIQSRIDHPNILPILYVKETTTDFHLVLEYASGGSLFQFIRKNNFLDEPLAFSLFIQVVNAVYFLHKNNLIHRDIKPENILLFDNNIIKLCDFGWCVKLEEGQQRGTFCGTTEYMSPELVNHEEYSKEIDVWSLGVLLYEMVHGYSPFRPDKPDFVAKDVIRNIRLHKLKFNSNVSEECKDLIYHLLDKDPIKRYKVEDIFNSDFVKFYEKRKFALPDNYLFEKYKFKMAKAKLNSISQNKNIKNNKTNKIYKNKNNNNNNIKHNKSFSSNVMKNNFEKIEDNLSVDNFNDKNIYSNNKEDKEIGNISVSLSDINIKCYKYYKNRIKKNNTSQYFHPINIIDNKINFSYLSSKSKNNHKRKITNSNNSENKENIQNNNQEISKNETKIKTIIINNYFPNIVKNVNNVNNENNENKKNEEEIGQILPNKKILHIKPLKMYKIPINSKIGNNAHSPTDKSNAQNLNFNRNYLVIKKNLSPKNQLNIENNKSNNYNNNKKINSNRIIEVNKNKYCNSPKIINNLQNPNLNKSNLNKKSYTRNNIDTTHYDKSKGNYNSEANFTNLNFDLNTNNSSYGNYAITSNYNDDFVKKKIMDKKLYSNKSLNQLKRKFSNENIKSMFISNIKNDINNLNNNSIFYENKCISNKNTIHIKKNSLNLNINEIKKINTTATRTKQNSPLSTFNNNFIYTIFNNNNRKQNSENKNSIRIRNNISTNNSYNFNNKKNTIRIAKSSVLKKDELNLIDFPKIKVHKTNMYTESNYYDEYLNKIHLDKILNYNDINKKNNKENINNNNNYYDKCRKLLNSMSQNSIFYQNKNQKIENRKKLYNVYKTENDKKIKKIPKIKTFKKNEILNINININNKRKNEYFAKYRCNSNTNINNKKILSLEIEKEKIKPKNHLISNRDNKNRNNSNKQNKNELKYKIIKKIELNDFLNNINKENKSINIITNNTNNTNNSNYYTSTNQSDRRKIYRINTSLNYKNVYENNKDYQKLKHNKYTLDSKNNKTQSQIENIKNNKNNEYKGGVNREKKIFNFDNKIRIINKKELKAIISPKLKNKKETDDKKNMNDVNLEIKYNINLNYNQNDYKSNNQISADKYRLYKKEKYGK